MGAEALEGYRLDKSALKFETAEGYVDMDGYGLHALGISIIRNFRLILRTLSQPMQWSKRLIG